MQDRRRVLRDLDVPERMPAADAGPLEPVGLLDAALGEPALEGRGGDVAVARLAIRLGKAAGNQALARRMTAGPSSRPILARKLIASGSAAHFIRFRNLVEPAIGLELARDSATNEVTAVATLADPATSPALVTILTRIMDDAARNAEVHFGDRQAGVAVGAFPDPTDMTGSREQLIDLDDVEAVEAGAPGNGIAKLAHEIQENYAAHAAAPAAGVDRFEPAHAEGMAAESAVAQDLVGPGNRVASRTSAGATAGESFRNQDFETYFLVFKLTQHGAADFRVTETRRADPVIVNTYTIDEFANGSDGVPAAGAASVAAASADLAGHPRSTCFVEGFTDNVGAATVNDPLSERRARAVRDQITGTGIAVGNGSFGVYGRGASSFVAPNTTEADRARNRRVVITVREPAAP